jgi:hypothetical protein
MACKVKHGVLGWNGAVVTEAIRNLFNPSLQHSRTQAIAPRTTFVGALVELAEPSLG